MDALLIPTHSDEFSPQEVQCKDWAFWQISSYESDHTHTSVFDNFLHAEVPIKIWWSWTSF